MIKQVKGMPTTISAQSPVYKAYSELHLMIVSTINKLFCFENYLS